MIFRKLNLKGLLLVLIIASVILSSISSTVLAIDEIRETIAASTVVNATTVKEFFDTSMEKYMKEYKIPGGAVTVVKNGEKIFTKGYGYGDLENKIPVDGDNTLFRIASVSKLFVWTAVMQLVEEGKLDLKTDINKYLKGLHITYDFNRPITVLDLMNHTSGFEERAIGESVEKAEDLKPLNDYLLEHIPQQVRPPGEISAYSNYGASLAGFIVSGISGMTFEDYVQKKILDPLEMKHSSFYQPLPSQLEALRAVGYNLEKDVLKPQEFEWKQSAPAGGMSASAGDMGNFIIAHLEGGTFNKEVEILKSSTVDEMHNRSFTNDPRVNGLAHGFMEGTFNGKRVLWHGGDIFHFHSALVLIPEENTGFFVTFNSGNSIIAVQDAIVDFMDKFYPVSNDSIDTISKGETLEALKAYPGYYEPARHEYTTLGKILGVFMSTKVMRNNNTGFTVTTGLPIIMDHEYLSSETDTLKPQESRNKLIGNIIFKRDAEGKVRYMFQENNPATAFVKLLWYETPVFTLGLVIGCILIFMVSMIIAIVQLIKKFAEKQKWNKNQWKLYFIPLLGSLVSLAFIILMGIMFSNQDIVFGLPHWSKYFFMLPWIIWLLAMITITNTVRLWKSSKGNKSQKIYYSIISLAIITFSVWIIQWNLWISKV